MSGVKRRVGRLIDKAQPVAHLDTGLTCVFYGKAGTGKTTLAGTFPTPILLLDFSEKGTASVADVEGLSVLSVDTWDTFDKVYWELAEDTYYKTVVIDALPGMQELAITEAKARLRKGDGDLTSQRDLGNATKLMKKLVYDYRNLSSRGTNVVFIAHDRILKLNEEGDDDDDEGIRARVIPNLMPSIADTIMGAVDIVGYMQIRVTSVKKEGVTTRRRHYCLLVSPHEYYTTKIRTVKGTDVPDEIKNPTYKKLRAILNK